MTLDSDKIDQAVLALLYLGLHNGARVWKGFDWDAMNRLYGKGFITDPRGKAKSVVFTEAGLVEARRLLEELFSSDTRSQAVSAARAGAHATPGEGVNTEDLIFQFRVSLLGTEPEIWRLIAVPATYSFWDLHVAIQDAMGWLDCHLHAFRVPDTETGKIEQIGIPDEGDQTFLPGWEIPIRSYFKQSGDSAQYEYDFGDGWEHRVVFEECVNRIPRKRYPICLDGARACPPEDCGGVPGFEELLEVLGDPTHEEHQSMTEWIGEELVVDIRVHMESVAGTTSDSARALARRWNELIGRFSNGDSEVERMLYEAGDKFYVNSVRQGARPPDVLGYMRPVFKAFDQG